ncbi:MAG: hypothetical protein DRP75_02175 [Candidatus Omnitrophota bacterium]|nr:MAG: hypothetical protein DRP75_02175 [Candidatus Omnitrophota bacterium]
MRIESYSFGLMVVEGRRYEQDLIIFPDRVKTNWWRKQGHSVCIEDLKEVREYKPEILIVGTGAYGLMQVEPSLKRELKNEGIEVIAWPTKEASEIFNKYIQEKRRVIGAFHLTC